MIQPPSFGTDGIRGLSSEHITPDLFFHLGQCAARYLNSTDAILVGHDGRESGEKLLHAFAKGAVSIGSSVIDAGKIPSGIIGWLCSNMPGVAAGAAITASHNPPEYNGIKFYDHRGSKLTRTQERQFLTHWEATRTPATGQQLCLDSLNLDTICSQLTAALQAKTESMEPLKGLRLLVDCANGAASPIAKPLLSALGAQVTTLNTTQPINTECGTNNPTQAIEQVQNGSFDWGLAFDGDGDRLMLITSKGQVLNGDDLLFMMALLMDVDRIAGTIMSNSGLEQALLKHKIAFFRSDVGETPLRELMLTHNLRIGGEPSGHLLDLDLMQSADGLISAAHLLASCSRSNQSAENLLRPLKHYSQLQKSIPLANPDFLALPTTQKLLDHFHQKAAQEGGTGSRIIVRESGTEPILRVMVEAQDEHFCHSLCDELISQLDQLMTSTASQHL